MSAKKGFLILLCLMLAAAASGALAETWSFEIVADRLVFTGSGVIPDYERPEDAPWAENAGEILHVILDSGITRIGANAFASLENLERLDFNQPALPEIAPNALSGVDAVCRYYTEDASFAAADKTAGGGTLSWLYLPLNNQDNRTNSLVYTDGIGWQIEVRNDDGDGYRYIPVTAAQALELTFADRWVVLNAVPESEEDKTVCETGGTALHHIGLYGDCRGSLAIDLPADANGGLDIEMNAPELDLTVTDPRALGLLRLQLKGGSVRYNGSIQTLLLRTSNHLSATLAEISGDVEHIDFYGSTTQEPFEGSVTVGGTVHSGVEYGSGTMSVPHISDEIPLSTMSVASFTDVRQDEPVILDGVLNIAGVTPVTGLTIDLFELTYHLYDDGWQLGMRYREDSGFAGEGPMINDVEAYNPDFSADDILWGETTDLYIWDIPEAGTVVLNGTAGSGGQKVGLRSIGGSGYTAQINCPVERLDITTTFFMHTPTVIVLNSHAESCSMSLNTNDLTLRLGEEGSIGWGSWGRPNALDRFFGPTVGACDVYADGTLQVLSWKDGEETQAILPSDPEMAESAGAGENQTAMMDIGDEDPDSFTEDEKESLEEIGVVPEAIAGVFGATVTLYDVDESGSLSWAGDVSELNRPVTVTVNNLAEEEAQVIRLHVNEDGTVSADAVSELTDEAVLTFSSDLFSKYLIVRAAASQGDAVYTWSDDHRALTAERKNPNTGETETETVSAFCRVTLSPTQDAPGETEYVSDDFANPAFKAQTAAGPQIPALGTVRTLRMPEGIETIEEEAFAGTSLQAVILPADRVKVESRAFADCASLLYVLAGPETEFAPDAFEGSESVAIDFPGE